MDYVQLDLIQKIARLLDLLRECYDHIDGDDAGNYYLVRDIEKTLLEHNRKIK